MIYFVAINEGYKTSMIMKNKLISIVLLIFVMVILMNMTPAITVHKVESLKYYTNPNIILAAGWTWNDAGKSSAVGAGAGALGGAVAGAWVCGIGAGPGALTGTVAGIVSGFSAYALGQAWDAFFGGSGCGGGNNILPDDLDDNLPTYALYYPQSSLD